MKSIKELFEDELFRLQAKYGHEVYNTKQRPVGGTYIGKGSKFANPWRGSRDANERLRNIYRYARYMGRLGPNSLTSEDKVKLKTTKVVCYCNDGSVEPNRDKFCHGLILKAIANDDFNWQQFEDISQ